MESAITIFLNNPEIIRKAPRFNLLIIEIVFLPTGVEIFALIIGPATNCGKMIQIKQNENLLVEFFLCKHQYYN